MDVLKTVQSKLLDVNTYDEPDTVCEHITGMFNATFKKYNTFESRLSTKLENIQEEQTIRLEEIISKQDKLNRACGTKGASSEGLDELVTLVTDVNGRVKIFEEKFKKLEVKFTEQKNDFNKFVDNQLKILQQINDKLNKNHEILEKYEKELPKLNNYVAPKPLRKLPMDIILGMSTANITGLK